MVTTLSEATEALKRWETQINLVLSNAHAVYESKPIQLLGDYQGITRQRAEEAKSKVARILAQALDIQAVVEQAREIHKSIVGFLPQKEKLEKIKQLLEGPSILSGESAPANSSASCDLLADTTTSAQKITPEALLRQMQTEFAVAKKSVDELTLSISEKENLAADADSFLSTLPPSPKLDELKKQVLAASESLLKDPLGSDNAAVAIRALIQSIKGAEQKEKEQTLELEALNVFATQKQVSLEALEEQERKTQEDLISKIQGASTLSHAPLVARLGTWLKALKDPNQNAFIRLASLRKWKEEALALETVIQRQVETDSARLQTREELKGRFLAFKAKCADLRLSEHPEIARAIDEVASALQRPSNLDRANRCLVELSNLLLAA